MSDPAAVAANDQDREEAKAHASVLGDFFLTLLKKGLERPEALTLTSEYQSELFEDKRPREE